MSDYNDVTHQLKESKMFRFKKEREKFVAYTYIAVVATTLTYMAGLSAAAITVASLAVLYGVIHIIFDWIQKGEEE